jgi:hypothetical protein
VVFTFTSPSNSERRSSSRELGKSDPRVEINKMNRTFDHDSDLGKGENGSKVNSTICFTAETTSTQPPKPKVVKPEGGDSKSSRKSGFWSNILNKIPK